MKWKAGDIDNLKNKGFKTVATSKPVSSGEIMTQSKGNRANKHNNTKVIIDGIPFDSISEGRRYGELKLLKSAAVITELELQPEYEFSINGVLVCKYRADFAYIQGGVRVVEDVKSEHTRTLPTYRIKHKLMKACYGITIKEVIY